MNQKPVYAASQLAWAHEENARAFAQLRACGYSGVEIVPLKAFGSWDAINDQAVTDLSTTLAQEGLIVPSMQALFFGISDIHVFKGEAERANLRAHILRCARLADQVGAKTIVFGAPKLRDPGERPSAAALDQAQEFFVSVGDELLKNSNATLTIEPVAAHHGGTFLKTHQETAAFIQSVNHPRIRLQFDLGCWLTHKEDEQMLPALTPLIAHSHISAPMLGRIDAAIAADARHCFSILLEAGLQSAISVEMLDNQLGGDWHAALEEARPSNFLANFLA